MNIILLSGGSGKRLWPLSNEIRSKQFLKLIKGENGEQESMVQRVYRQICSAGIDANIVVATGKVQIDSIKSQLGDKVDIVLEPERRDTFPAISLASSYLIYEKKMDPDEVVLVLPVDPYAELKYFDTLLKLEQVIKSGLANIALMGIKPTYPSAKYGYIVPNKEKHSEEKYTYVERFQEKPTEDYAIELIKKEAMWNGGVFAFKLGYLMEIIKKYIAFNSFEDVTNQYVNLPKISFDYEVVEKEASIAMVEYDGTWKDLGTWNTLTEVMEDKAIGKIIMADNCYNTHVINELDIPITVLGAKDMVIAASPDGILVSDKHQSSYLKQYVDNISQRPMYEERRWGEYKVLDYLSYDDGTISLTKHIHVKNGEMISYQSHKIRDEIWTIVDGTGDLILDGHIRNIRRGDVAYITKGMKHAIRATSDLRFIEVQIGLELSEMDLEYFDYIW
jgi:mannose-1-phosphate guanylyltransferase